MRTESQTKDSPVSRDRLWNSDPKSPENTIEKTKAKTLGPLRMVFLEAAKYRLQVFLALVALTITAAGTLAIPAASQLIVDRGFSGDGDIGRWFRYLLMIVVVIGFGTAARFYFVSWIGERVVADIRLKVQRNLLRLSPSFYEENSPKEISSRMTADTAIIETVVGTTVSVALRNMFLGVGGTIIFWLLPSHDVACPRYTLDNSSHRFFGRRSVQFQRQPRSCR